MPNRSDYMQIYMIGGPEALNEVLRERFPGPEAYDRELSRMERSGNWEIAFDVEGGMPIITRRLPQPGSDA